MVERLTQDDSPVAAYLVEQVLERLEPGLRQFVLDTSVVERFTPALAAAVTGRDDADAVLRELVASHAFLLRLDTVEPTYRYHALFGALLQHRLTVERGLDHAREVHRRAAEQLYAEGESTEAVRHALEATAWSTRGRHAVPARGPGRSAGPAPDGGRPPAPVPAAGAGDRSSAARPDRGDAPGRR